MVPLFRIILAIVCCTGIGCMGVSQNPSYFPYLLPSGDVIRTHGKPGGIGYFRNYDPKAIQVEVTPTSNTNPTLSQQVLIATVTDRDGNPRRKRRIEWILDGPGSIIEVDESGYAPGRGYKVDNKYAVSYADYFSHTITRGNDDPRDDFEIKPGQTWCVVTSPVEGQTTVTVYAPEVFDWEKGRTYVKLTWTDGLFRADPSSRTRSDKDDGFGSTAIEKRGLPATAQLSIDVKMPRTLALNREVPIVLSLANDGRTDSSSATVRTVIPEGTEFVSSDPVPIRRSGSAVSWYFESVPGGGARNISLVLRPIKKGTVLFSATAETLEGLKATKSATGEADNATMKIKVEAPAFTAAGDRMAVKVSATNTGSTAIDNAIAWVDVPAGMSASAKGNPAELSIGEIPPGETRTASLPLVAERTGKFTVKANVTADGGLVDRGEVIVAVAKTEIELNLTGTDSIPVGQDGLFELKVTNRGDVPVANVIARMSLPRGLTGTTATDGGRLAADGATWNLGTLAAGDKKIVRLTATGDRLTDRQTITASAGAELGGGGRVNDVRASMPVAVVGQPVLSIEHADPVGPISIGGKATYRITVRNRGTGPAKNVTVVAEASEELLPVRGSGPNRDNAKIVGREFVFPVIEEFAAGSIATFTVEVEATKAGDARMTARLQSGDIRLKDEQATRIVTRSTIR